MIADICDHLFFYLCSSVYFEIPYNHITECQYNKLITNLNKYSAYFYIIKDGQCQDFTKSTTETTRGGDNIGGI